MCTQMHKSKVYKQMNLYMYVYAIYTLESACKKYIIKKLTGEKSGMEECMINPQKGRKWKTKEQNRWNKQKINSSMVEFNVTISVCIVCMYIYIYVYEV